MTEKKKASSNSDIANHPLLHAQKTFGQKSADALTKWAGSWTFIFTFLIIIAIWISANVYGWVNEWDPYPFILLNLALSLLAAIQAPIILMSQNREAQKEKLEAKYNYAVNRKAEREIQDLKELLLALHVKQEPSKNSRSTKTTKRRR